MPIRAPALAEMSGERWVVKNTFVELVEEPSSPLAPPPPTKTAPGQLQQAPPDHAEPCLLDGAVRRAARRLVGACRGRLGRQEAGGDAAARSSEVVAAVRGGAHPGEVAPAPSHAAPPAPEPAPTAHCAHRGGPARASPGAADPEAAACASLGSEGHAEGQCIPCLMQVRWLAGKNSAPCRFGELCGRCHEAHTEEELHRVQAMMRKLKRRAGAESVAVLSAAARRGAAAPIGAGAGAAEQRAQVVEVSI